MCRAKDIVVDFINMTREIKHTYESNISNIDNRNLETLDFLHEIELGNLNAVQRIKVFNQLRESRQSRRLSKDDNETMIYLYDLFKSLNNFERDLQKVLSNIDKTINKMNTKEYHPRIREDLTIGSKITFQELKEKLEKNNP